MFIYQRHIISNTITPSIVVILTMTGLVWISQIVKLIYLIDRGVGFGEFISLIVLVLPSLLFITLPLAIVVGVLVSYNRLSDERELVALSNSGISLFSLAKPALIVATWVTIIGYFISAYLLPLSYSALKAELHNFRNKYVSNLVQERVFTQVIKNVTLYIDAKSPGGLLKGLIIFDDRNNDRKVIFFAKSGRVRFQSGYPSLELFDGIRQEVYQFDKINKMHFSSLSVSLSNDKCNQDITSESADIKSVNASECQTTAPPPNRDLQAHYINELFAPDDNLSDSKRIKLRSEGHQRLIWPLYSLALTSLALGLFMQKPYSRRGNFTILLKIGLAIVVVVGLHFISYNAASKNEALAFLSYINLLVCFFLSYLLLSEKISFNKLDKIFKYFTLLLGR